MEKSKDTYTPVQRFWRLLRSEKKEITNIYIYALFNGLLSLSIPLGIQAIINLIQSATASTAWIVLVLLVLVGLIFMGIFQVFQLRVAEKVQQHIFAKATMEFAYRIPRLKLSALKSNYPPELINRFFDVMTIQKGLYKLLFDFSVASLQILFGLILLSLYHPFFVIFSFFLLFTLYLFFKFTSRRGLETSLSESSNKYKVVSWLEEMARNLSTFKMAGKTNLPLERADTLNQAYLSSRQDHFNVLLKQYYTLIGFKTIVAGGLLLIGGLLVFDQQMNIGQFVAAEIVIVQIISSVEKLVYSIENIYDVLTGLEKVGTVTDLELENQSEPQREMLVPGDPVRIRLSNVSVPSPQWQQRIILRNLTLDIKAGEKVAIAGNMGAGKSSFLQLLAGLFDKYEGHLAYNGTNLSNINLESLRSVIGDNLRQEELFEASVLDNISLGRESVDRQQVEKLIDITGLSIFIENLPQGLHTVLPSSGIGLSSSLRNRLLMARSLAGTHSLLLIEDNWFDVDPETRNRWLNYLCLDCNHTIVVASNKADILEKMDRILIIKDGAIVREGTYQDCKDHLPC